MKAKAKENRWDFDLFRKRGLLLWLVRAQHDHSVRKQMRKRIWEIFICLPITKANAKTNLRIFICNNFCEDGAIGDKKITYLTFTPDELF